MFSAKFRYRNACLSLFEYRHDWLSLNFDFFIAESPVFKLQENSTFKSCYFSGGLPKAEDHLKSVLPREFMRLSMSLHQDFDQFAADAESKKDSNKLTLRQLSGAIAKCVACHDAYQINKAPASGQPVKAKEHGHHHHH